jgi:hypothetical protein
MWMRVAAMSSTVTMSIVMSGFSLRIVLHDGVAQSARRG